MRIKPHEYLGRVLVTDDGPILPPDIVWKLLGALTDAEMPELEAYAKAEGSDRFPLRTSEWLIRRFGLVLRERQ